MPYLFLASIVIFPWATSFLASSVLLDAFLTVFANSSSVNFLSIICFCTKGIAFFFSFSIASLNDMYRRVNIKINYFILFNSSRFCRIWAYSAFSWISCSVFTIEIFKPISKKKIKKHVPPPWIEHGAFRSSVWRSPSWAKAARSIFKPFYIY